jgi:hypothetical protein
MTSKEQPHVAPLISEPISLEEFDHEAGLSQECQPTTCEERFLITRPKQLSLDFTNVHRHTVDAGRSRFSAVEKTQA